MGRDDEDTTVARRTTQPIAPGDAEPYLLVVSGQALGQAVRLTQHTTLIGRGDDVDLRLDDDGVSRHHAKVVQLSPGVLMIKDLDSTNGTFVNETRIDAHPLRAGDRIRIGATSSLKFSLDDQLEASVRQHLFEAAMRDPLTGLSNRRFFEDELERALAFARRHRQPLCLVMLDLDHFKRVNDTHGHPAGDTVLSAVARRLQETVRAEDCLARVGGEEFAVVMSGNDLGQACQAAERLRREVIRRPILAGGHDLEVTASFGVAQFDPAVHDAVADLVGAADAELYAAKQAGRNRVAPPPNG